MGTRKAINITSISSADDINDKSFGIYAYVDQYDKVLYIGKDSNIDKNHRHLYHCSPSKRTEQLINKIVQSDGADTWIRYAVIHKCIDEAEMNNLEVLLILMYKAIGMCKYNTGIDMNKKEMKKLGKSITTLADTIKTI